MGRPSEVTFELSLDPVARSDPAPNILKYESKAKAKTKDLKQCPKGSEGERGLGSDGEKYHCLKCIEILTLWYGVPNATTNLPSFDKRFRPHFSLANYIVADEKVFQQHPSLFSLHGALVYALEKWKAVKLYDQYVLDGRQLKIWARATAKYHTTVIGEDSESLYLIRKTGNFNAIFSDGASAKITAADVRGKSLSKVLEHTRDMAFVAGNLDKHGLLSHLTGYHDGFQPLFAVAYWIEAGTRTLPGYPDLSRLHPAYDLLQTANINTTFEDGASAKISAADVRGKSLSKVLEHTQDFIVGYLEGKMAEVPVPPNTQSTVDPRQMTNPNQVYDHRGVRS